jgi:hypothetical protein
MFRGGQFMHPRYSLLATLLWIGFAFAVSPVQANKPEPVFLPVRGTSGTGSPGQPKLATPVCQTGMNGAPQHVVSYIIPPDDQYFTLINAEACDCPPGGGLVLSAAHILLEFGDLYSTPVRVGIVAADLSNPDCPVPVPGQYLCSPVDFGLAGPDYGTFDITLPLSNNCTITGKAFLEITFTDWGLGYTTPNLLLTASCESCNSYNYYPGNHYDLCTFGFEGNPIMYVDGACTGAVAVHPDSWGRVKTLYR